jgi:large subunit ribosomal protein L29
MEKEKLRDLRDKPTDQIESMLKERRRHLFDLRSQSVTEKLEDPSQLGKTRKQIARLSTFIRQRALAEKKPAGK